MLVFTNTDLPLFPSRFLTLISLM